MPGSFFHLICRKFIKFAEFAEFAKFAKFAQDDNRPTAGRQ
jgi:hypothetical protein